MGKMNHAIPRGTTPAGVMAQPSGFHDDRPFGLKPWWQPRTETQREKDERWRAEYSASLRDTPHYRTGNVLVW